MEPFEPLTREAPLPLRVAEAGILVVASICFGACLLSYLGVRLVALLTEHRG